MEGGMLKCDPGDQLSGIDSSRHGQQLFRLHEEGDDGDSGNACCDQPASHAWGGQILARACWR
jgi:hypothetical protein